MVNRQQQKRKNLQMKNNFLSNIYKSLFKRTFHYILSVFETLRYFLPMPKCFDINMSLKFLTLLIFFPEFLIQTISWPNSESALIYSFVYTTTLWK